MFGVPVAIGLAGILFLDARRIWQHELAQVGSARRAEDSTAEPLRHEAWQVANVIEVGVSQYYGFDRIRWNRKLVPVSKPQLLQTLKKAAIDEQTVTLVLEQVLRAGHRSGRAEKRQSGHSVRIAGPEPAILSPMVPVSRLCTALCLCAATLTVAGLSAQTSTRALSIDTIYSPERRVDFTGSPQTALRWLDDGTYLQTRRTATGIEWLRIAAATGTSSPLFDRARLESALAALPGISPEVARRGASDPTFNLKYSAAFVVLDDDLYHYDFGSTIASRLTNAAGSEDEPTFSPDGRWVAFVRDNNLRVVEVATRQERALTTDGSPDVLNGKLDWLYQEEIYGRGRFRGYWWSPDSARLAFLRLDERPVPEYTVVDDIPYRPTVEVTDYPKAGDANPHATLGIASLSDAGVTWVDLASYPIDDRLIVEVDWVPDSSALLFQVQDREQRRLDLNLVDVGSERPRRVLQETTSAWVNVNGNPVWLRDGTFLWLSERSGFKHLYRYRRDGTLVQAVTNGSWEIRTFHGVDEDRGFVYFEAGMERNIDTDVYRVGLDGSGLTRLSRSAGTHRARFSPSYSLYLDMWSSATMPTQVRLHGADGAEIRVIDANDVPALREYRLSVPEFLEVRTRDGFVMDAMMIKPPNFDSSRRYPVYQFTYAGPGTPSVRNSWGGSTYLYHQLLAQQGIIVWILDNRSASGKGAASQWPVYQNLGALELRDLEDGVAWLRRQPYVDASRIALHGWSYGGFMTAYALTHSTSWAAGIVGAPVTDWRNYDTVYTERYMRTPQNNADGYRQSAPRFAADKLQGRLLLIHGGIDDNVHRQNSEQFVYELQRAGKTFELMIYPRQRHGISDPRLNEHLRQTMFDFITRALGADTAPRLPGSR
jgi:dipeptidyl-peptidase-4